MHVCIGRRRIIFDNRICRKIVRIGICHHIIRRGLDFLPVIYLVWKNLFTECNGTLIIGFEYSKLYFFAKCTVTLCDILSFPISINIRSKRGYAAAASGNSRRCHMHQFELGTRKVGQKAVPVNFFQIYRNRPGTESGIALLNSIISRCRILIGDLCRKLHGVFICLLSRFPCIHKKTQNNFLGIRCGYLQNSGVIVV